MPPEAWKPIESDIPVSKCINFGKAQLILGAIPRANTPLDAVPLGESRAYNELEKIVTSWLTTFCLENGYQDFGQELTPPREAD